MLAAFRDVLQLRDRAALTNDALSTLRRWWRYRVAALSEAGGQQSEYKKQGGKFRAEFAHRYQLGPEPSAFFEFSSRRLTEDSRLSALICL